MNKFISLFLIILHFSSFAQEKIAKEILDKLSATTKSYKNITIEFDFLLENKNQNIKEIQEGSLTLQENKFHLTIDNQIIINDGETQWIYLSDVNELQIMNHDPEESMMQPDKIFTIYEENYKYSYMGSENNNDKKLELIDLFPEESQEFIKINIAINSIKNQLERITLHDRNGSTYSYIIKSFTTNTSIKPFYFNTTDFPNVEIIDLRE